VVTVKDLARRRVAVPAQFRIPRSQIVWREARMAMRRGQFGERNVILTRVGDGNDWSVKADEQVLVAVEHDLPRGKWVEWVAYEPNGAAAPVVNGAHAAHMQCGGFIGGDRVHALRHAKRNPGCNDCDAIVAGAMDAERKEREAAAKAEASIAPVVLAGPDVADVETCGHDPKTLALIIVKARKDPHADSVLIAGKRLAILGRGVSRVAVDLGCEKHVLKVQYGHGGGFNQQARPECEAYLRLTPEQRADVARIFAWTADYAGVVFEKAYKDAAALVAALRERAHKMGFGDLHANNLGFRPNGQPIVLDFGL
jgi:hypothetical protein